MENICFMLILQPDRDDQVAFLVQMGGCLPRRKKGEIGHGFDTHGFETILMKSKISKFGAHNS